MKEELRKRIVEKIKDKSDYERMLDGFKLSRAPLKDREEAITFLKLTCPQYETIDKHPNKELFEQIKAGEADIDDIGAGY